MSLIDLDNSPRMAGNLRPEDLNDNGCVALASRILTDAAENYILARRHLDQDPANKDAIEHYQICREFYNRELFVALSCGAVSPKATVKELDRMARGNTKAGGRQWHGTAM
jgi:hypothetical protein